MKVCDTVTRFAVLGLFFLILLVPAAAQNSFPLTIKDAGGTQVRISAQPKRVVSLTLYSDEVLMGMLDRSRIQALSSYAKDTHTSNIQPSALKGMVTSDFNTEFILSLRPDLVLVADWSDAAKVALLRQAGIPVFVLATPTSIESMKSGIALLGRLCGAQAGAADMIAAVDRRLAAVRNTLAAAKGLVRLRALDYNSWGSANGAGSSWDDLLARAGLLNGAAAYPAGPFAQVSLSKEIVVAMNPDLVFVPDWTYGTEDDAQKFLQSIKTDPVLTSLKAWKNGRVFPMSERLKSTVSQYMADAVEYLAAAAYPELFGQSK